MISGLQRKTQAFYSLCEETKEIAGKDAMHIFISAFYSDDAGKIYVMR